MCCHVIRHASLLLIQIAFASRWLSSPFACCMLLRCWDSGGTVFLPRSYSRVFRASQNTKTKNTFAGEDLRSFVRAVFGMKSSACYAVMMVCEVLDGVFELSLARIVVSPCLSSLPFRLMWLLLPHFLDYFFFHSGWIPLLQTQKYRLYTYLFTCSFQSFLGWFCSSLVSLGGLSET